ncbi:MAG: ArnT family glycosyltransferase [bacterium]
MNNEICNKKSCKIKELIFNYPKSFLTLVSIVFFFPLIGSCPLLCQWEPHYGRVAMEMMANNSWDWFLDPVYLGVHNFWSKPIFCFWMVFPFMKILGPTELALRLPFAINGVLFVLLIYFLSEKLFSDKARSLVAGFVTILMPYTYLITRQFMWDITFVTFLTGAIGFLFIGQRDKNKKFLFTAYLFMGLGMLTKGLLALFFPLAIILIWMLITLDYTKKFKEILSDAFLFIKSLSLIEGLGIFFVVSGWWYIYMAFKHGLPFYKEFFGQHHFGRLGGMIDKPDGPFDFYAWQLSVGTFPWIGFFVPGLYFSGKKMKEKKEEGFVIISFFFLFLFFTLAATKFPHYVFPVVPFMSMIVASLFVELFRNEKISKAYPVIAVTAALVVGIVGKDLGTGMSYVDFIYIITTHKVQSWFGRVFDMLPYLSVFVPIMVAFILLPMVSPSKKWLVKTFVAGFTATTLAWSGYMNFYWVPNMLDVFTPKPLVEKYFELKKDGDIIVDFDNWKNRSMYFYLGLEENLHRVSKVEQIQKLIEKHPENTVYITTKEKKVSELRAALLSSPGVPIRKIMDDAVDTYAEIEMYAASMKDRDSAVMEKWKENIVSEEELPKNLKKINSTLNDGEIEIVGYTVNKERFDPSEEMVLTVYYKPLKIIEKSWKVFFHFDVYRGALPHSWKMDDFPQRGFHPTNKWEKDVILKDEFVTTIPDSHPGGGIKIYTGFFIDKDRMKIDKESYNDGQNRFILGTFSINIK